MRAFSCACRGAEGRTHGVALVLDTHGHGGRPSGLSLDGEATGQEEGVSRRTACSPSTRGWARLGRRRSETAAIFLKARRPELGKTRTATAIPGGPR